MLAGRTLDTETSVAALVNVSQVWIHQVQQRKSISALRVSTSLTKRCCQQILLPNPWKVRGDRLQDHGTGRRSFSSRASPRGVNGQRKITFINLMEDVIEACKRSHKATSVRPIRRRSPYVIGMRQRGPAHRAIYRRRTVLSQTPPQPTPNLNLATYRQSIWSRTLYPAFVSL